VLKLAGDLSLKTVVLRCRRILANVDRATIWKQPQLGIEIEIVEVLVRVEPPTPAANVVNSQFQILGQRA
jgi:hypothetical protein